MYASGREALLAAWRNLKDDPARALFVPDYFCDEVVSWWERRGVAIRRYGDGPYRPAPDWETLTVSPGDAVLAVNYFGVRDGKTWDSWRRAHGDVLLVEDHSHDPLSGWALDSVADYAFSSLRKTFPTPDGAILWSPSGLPLPDEPISGDWRGSALKLAAMVLKSDYLAGRKEESVKEAFRSFQIEGEKLLGEATEPGVSPWGRFLLATGFPIRWRERRKENVMMFMDLIAGIPSVRPLFTDWPASHCPLNAVLLFPTRGERDACSRHLVESGVYPSVHWEQRDGSSQESLDLSGRILTVPADQRYGRDDIMRVASIISNRCAQ
jgi:hypothetical protein